jgi:hypothetical protein
MYLSHNGTSHNKQEAQMTFAELLLRPQLDLYRSVILTRMPRRSKCTNIPGNYTDNNNISVK